MVKTEKKTTPAWMSVGSEGKEALQQEEAKAEAKAKEFGKARRFWIPAKKETAITFLDGDLDDENFLIVGVWWEHQLKINGSFRNWFTCTKKLEQKCPICNSGDEPYLAGAMTVIDHGQYTDKNGKVHKDERRLFVAKRNTLALLNKLAVKRGSLTGCTFDVSRTGDRVASVGDVFDFTEKRSLAELADLYPSAEPFNYAEEIVYRSYDELVQLGLGANEDGGSSPGVGADAGADDDFDD